MQRFSGLLKLGWQNSIKRVFRQSVAFEITYAPKRSPKADEDLKTLRARLLYQSKKRGILENDILIGDFAEENLEKMNHDELMGYDRLINGTHMEWDLYYYMSGKKEPPSEIAKCPVFLKLKEYVSIKAKSSHK